MKFQISDDENLPKMPHLNCTNQNLSIRIYNKECKPLKMNISRIVNEEKQIWREIMQKSNWKLLCLYH